MLSVKHAYLVLLTVYSGTGKNCTSFLGNNEEHGENEDLRAASNVQALRKTVGSAAEK